ncbi:hypothetical protein [Hafnia alvei]|uniref:hypothetical protein n=1 Tax=Hafnia alvei TaxID=569 RepID=UPI0011C0268F|nr:hypothetical protein [Hafnia alvei]
MNANQLTKIPVEKLSDTLQFLIVENEIPLSDALKQVIDDVDAVCKKLLRDEQAPAQPALVEKLKKVMNSWLAMEPKLAFQPEFTDVMMLLDAEPAPAQPVIPEQSELRYGDNVLWFLNELAAFDASDIDSDDFDVYGEDRNGMEGCATISITELAADAAKLLSAQPVSEPYKLPDGWVMVPEEATIAMLTLLGLTGSFDFMQQKYKNMLAAAPAQESE